MQDDMRIPGAKGRGMDARIHFHDVLTHMYPKKEKDFIPRRMKSFLVKNYEVPVVYEIWMVKLPAGTVIPFVTPPTAFTVMV